MKNLICLSLILCIGALSGVASGQETSGKQVTLSIEVSEENPEAVRRKILAEPTIVTTIGRAFSYKSGGIVNPHNGNERMETGTQISGVLDRTEDGALQLRLKIQLAATVAQEDDPNTKLLRTETIEFRTVVRPDKPKRINCSAHQWCEIRVSK